jgi:DNA invertase Pin-like site-specific DNA recombinase
MVRLIDYARVSTNGQTLDAQVRTLEAAGAAVIFEETASGARTDRAARESYRRIADRRHLDRDPA